MPDLKKDPIAKQPDQHPGGMKEVENQISRVEIIAPVRVTRKAALKEIAFNKRNNLIKGLTLAFVFVFLIIGGLWLWHYLAGFSAEKHQAQIPVSEQHQVLPMQTDAKPAAESEKPPDPARLAAEKEQAEQKLAEFMQLKQELESKAAPTWANEAYSEMIQLAQQADQLLIENNHVAAGEKYAQASAKARILTDQIAPTLKRLLAEGQTALAEGNAELARQKLSVALMIDPDNRPAQHGLQRAKNAAAVARLLEQGAAHEKEGNIAFALADYQEALRLDPESKEAQQALMRAKRLVSDEEFQRLMSEGLAALQANNYSLAREKLMKAQSFRPSSQEAKDALAQVDQSIRLAGIETYRQKAADAEKAENWEQALDAYLQVLKIDPDVRFASQGKQRALDHIRIDKRINFFLQQPAVLESDPQLENAVQLMAEIEKIDPQGPRLKDQLAKLARMVNAARTPVTIILESDGLTEVAVYKVGKLGRFTSRELSLRPGTYTAVGTREGYQDVRRHFTIKAGQAPAHIAIQCEVKI